MFSNIITEKTDVMTIFNNWDIFLNDNENIKKLNRITQSVTVAINSAIV